MSLSASPIDVTKVYDPRIDVFKEREFVITKGANKIAYTPYRSATTGTSAMSFNVVPSSRNTFVDRKMYIETSISLIFSYDFNAAPDAGYRFVVPNYDAPRSFPLNRAIATSSAQIGNGAANMQTSEVIDALLRCMPTDELKDYNSGCPTALDESQTYDCYTNASGLNVLGNVTQPLLENGEFARGVFNVTVSDMIKPVGDGAGKYQQVVNFKVYEPVLLSPFVWQKMNHSGFIGVQSIGLTLNFANNLTPLVWSGTLKKNGAAGPIITPDVAVNFAPATVSGRNISIGQSDAQLWVGTYSPSTLMEIPKQVTYNYYQVEAFPTTGYSALAYGGKTTITSNNIQLKVIPSMVIAGVRRTKASQKWYHPDCYYGINKASVNFGNGTGILSTASQFNLFQISRKNGLNSTFNQWLGKYGNFNTPAGKVGNEIPSGTGGLLVMKPNEDWGLADGEASGMSGAYNFQVALDIECIDPSQTDATTQYELIVIIVSEGQWTIDVQGSGNVSTQIGILSEADVLKAETKPWLNYENMNGLVGGDFLGNLRNWGERASSMVHAVADLAPKASSALKSVGLGRGAGYGAGLIGSGVSGGAVESQKSQNPPTGLEIKL